jgi:hypothetical protein
MKTKLFFALASLLFSAFTHAGEDDGVDGILSDSEIALCRAAGCLEQGVSKDMTIKNVGPESVMTDEKGDKYLNTQVDASGEGFSLQYSIVQWIGNGDEVDAAKQEDARMFAKKLADLGKTHKKVNLVVRGSANVMTAKFPITGYFTQDGEFYFQRRVVAPLLKNQ